VGTHTVYLALGTNLGNKHLNLLNAIALITENIGILSAISSVHETDPWGFESKNSFLNMVVKAETSLSPMDLLETVEKLEKTMGREKKTDSSGYKDRLIDIDIILYDNWVYQSEKLTLPHPFYKERDFVLNPLKEIAPDLVQKPGA
jgi:2-amino-4-hydroxy-6-hydroxymethyldihydropteridine diphosphokinase